MAFDIEQFKARGPRFGGARPTTFEVIITGWPGSTSNAEQQLRFMCKATQIPPSVIGQVEVPYFGRRIKVIGDRQYANWNITIINDEDYVIRRALETWHQNMNMHIENAMTGDVTPEPISYKRDAVIRHYSRDGGTIIQNYTVKGMFPVQIDAMPLDWEAIDQITMFDVEFSLDYWLPVNDTGRDEVSSFPEGARNTAASFSV